VYQNANISSDDKVFCVLYSYPTCSPYNNLFSKDLCYHFKYFNANLILNSHKPQNSPDSKKARIFQNFKLIPEIHNFSTKHFLHFFASSDGTACMALP
jgi:hypothetical protein